MDRISLTPPLNASFEMHFIEKGNDVVLSSSKNIVTPEMHNEIKKLTKGDKVIIQKVALTAPDGSTRIFDGPTIYVQ